MRHFLPVTVDKVGYRLGVVSMMLFVLLLGDGVLSYWLPVHLEEVFGSAAMMGLILAFSSVIGLVVDFVLPQLLVQVSVRRMMLLAVMMNLGFGLLLLLGLVQPMVMVFLVAVGVWGIFYEFVSFAKQSFVAGSIPHKLHASAWGVIGMFVGLAYFLGPLLGEYLMQFGDGLLVFAAMMCSVFSLWFLLILKNKRHIKVKSVFVKVNLWSELSHWQVIFEHVWQIVLVSFLLMLVDALMWTTGAVYTSTLGEIHPLGGWFLSLYMLPMMFVGIFISRLNIVHGKKHLSEVMLLMTGILLVLLGLVTSIWIQLGLVLMVGFVSGAIAPLAEAVYSDILERMGRQQKHLIGLSSSSASVAYIAGPILAGLSATLFGNQLSFAALGCMVIVGAVVALMNTPKKLKVPQKMIKEW